MSDVSVKGIYRDGVVELSETVAASNGQSVLVIFPDRLPPQPTKSYREELRERIAQGDPQFLEMTKIERDKEFERISSKIANSLPYRTPEDLKKAMRRENFDPS